SSWIRSEDSLGISDSRHSTRNLTTEGRRSTNSLVSKQVVVSSFLENHRGSRRKSSHPLPARNECDNYAVSLVQPSLSGLVEKDTYENPIACSGRVAEWFPAPGEGSAACCLCRGRELVLLAATNRPD